MATDQIGAPIYLVCAMASRHLLPNAVSRNRPATQWSLKQEAEQHKWLTSTSEYSSGGAPLWSRIQEFY